MEDDKVKSKRGGARPGAGRKRKYENKPDYKRIKVKKEHYDFLKVQLSMLGNTPELTKMLYQHTPCMLDGSEPEEKEIGLQKWKEYDAIKSIFPLEILQRKDYKIFALAWYILKPEGLRINFVKEDKVGIKWNQFEELINLIFHYGFLLGIGLDRLHPTHQNIYRAIPSTPFEVYSWIKEQKYLHV